MKQIRYAARRVVDGWADFYEDRWLVFIFMTPFLLVFTPIVFLKALFFEERVQDVDARSIGTPRGTV